MPNQLNVGDTVKLKSGGPAMTVSNLLPGGELLCLWFDNAKKKHHAAFPADTLVAWNPSEDD